jgi:hypothetical protein
MIALFVFFLMDLIKIVLAKKIYKNINYKFVSIFRKSVGCILFGMVLFLKSFFLLVKK